jgi:hypothetical protein
VAAAVLEVLAGARTPEEASSALALSLPRYYQVESQALRGLVAACEPKPRGRQADVGRELAELRRENERLRREAGRQQALVRAAQRSVGLALPAPTRPGGKKPRRRRPARGLNAAARLQVETADNPTAVPPRAPRRHRRKRRPGPQLLIRLTLCYGQLQSASKPRDDRVVLRRAA